jgi:hypothetical protein
MGFEKWERCVSKGPKMRKIGFRKMGKMDF